MKARSKRFQPIIPVVGNSSTANISLSIHVTKAGFGSSFSSRKESGRGPHAPNLRAEVLVLNRPIRSTRLRYLNLQKENTAYSLCHPRRLGLRQAPSVVRSGEPRGQRLVEIDTSIAKIGSDPERVRKRAFRRRLVEIRANV